MVKAGLFLAFILSAVYAVWFTPASKILTVDKMKGILDTSGFSAPLIFILIYTIGACLFIPGSVLTTLGAAIFGTYWGFVYVMMGQMLGASAAFFIGRYMGRDFASSVIGVRLKAYDKTIARNGFAAVFYLRLIYFPYTPLNFGMGLTRIRFWEYFWGTGLGLLAGTFVIIFFLGTLKEIWIKGDPSQILSGKVFLSIALLIFSFFIPKILKNSKKSY